MKELLLIFEFNQAPQELKTAAESLRDVQKQLLKSKQKFEELRIEVLDLEKKQSQLEREFQSNLKRWEPESLKANVKKGEAIP